VRDRRTFGALRSGGTRHRSGPIVITALLDPGDTIPKVAYAVNRSVGGAVDRNRLRRRLRAIVRAVDLAPGTYLVTASSAAAALPHEDLATHVHRAVREATAS
jgi:ribonuclease P protein component